MKLMKALTTATIELGVEAVSRENKIYVHAKIESSTWGSSHWFFEAEDSKTGLDPKTAGAEDFEPFDPNSEWQQEYIKKHFPNSLDRFTVKAKDKHLVGQQDGLQS